MEESVLSPEEQENLIDVFRILKLWREKRHERLRLEECEAADNGAEFSAQETEEQ
nr:hypothetical protein HAGR004_24810 [Bdellovibrio sp. HAGR004]